MLAISLPGIVLPSNRDLFFSKHSVAAVKHNNVLLFCGMQVQPQGSESFLPAIKASESTLRKQQTGSYAQAGKRGGPGIRSLQHQGSDRWAESKRDAGMVAYSARWQ